jgi:hypothetical protein
MNSCVSRSSLQLWQFGSEQYGEPIGMCGEPGCGLEGLAIYGLRDKMYPSHMRPTPQARRSDVEEMSAAYDIRMPVGVRDVHLEAPISATPAIADGSVIAPSAAVPPAVPNIFLLIRN